MFCMAGLRRRFSTARLAWGVLLEQANAKLMFKHKQRLRNGALFVFSESGLFRRSILGGGCRRLSDPLDDGIRSHGSTAVRVVFLGVNLLAVDEHPERTWRAGAHLHRCA